MKRLFVLLFSLLLCVVSYADTINLHWLNYDGTSYQDSTCVIDSDLILPSTPPTRYGYTFTGWKMANYIPIEYLESTGTQWINTNFIPNQNSRFQIKIKFDSINQGTMIGARKGSGDNMFAIASAGNNVPYHFNGGYINWGGTTTNPTDTNIHVLDLNKNVFSIDDSINKIFIQTQIQPGINAYMFIMNTNGTAQSSTAFIGKFYECKIWDNGTLVRDFIPVLDKNNVPCMFDKVEGKFYYNQGTGNFIAGPVL